MLVCNQNVHKELVGMSYDINNEINPETLPLFCNPEPNVQHGRRSVIYKNNIVFKLPVASTAHLMLFTVLLM
jgi:hypothetical protein